MGSETRRTRTLTIRGLDGTVVAELKARASRAGQSLSAYAGQILTEAASRPDPNELAGRATALGPGGD
jgi:plasmid stability protein